MDISKAIQVIQYVLAPALLVSSAALLLLGFQNKFSSLANRFRLLNHEKQVLSNQTVKTPAEEIRFLNLKEQVEHLFRRASLMKNAILLTYIAMVFLIGTSILILINLYSVWQLHDLIIVTFSLGLLCLFLTAIVMILETNLFYRVLAIEKKSRVSP